MILIVMSYIYGLDAKKKSGFQHGSEHMLAEIKRQNTCLKNAPRCLDHVRKFTQINGYYAHSENVLVNLICSKRKQQRRLGVKRILEIRKGEEETGSEPSTVRKYRSSPINWDAKTVYKLIDLKESATEPPGLRHKQMTRSDHS